MVPCRSTLLRRVAGGASPQPREYGIYRVPAMEVPRLRAETAAIQLRATAIGRAVCSDKATRSWGSLVSTTGSGQALA
jgi:hypothetical protein